MYDDKDPWPFKCPECGEEFTKEIGWLKAQSHPSAFAAPEFPAALVQSPAL
jgi:hypothetical protein